MNFPANGWDERDYELWSQLQGLPSYGVIDGDTGNPAVSLKSVLQVMVQAAEKRFKDARARRKQESLPNQS